MQIARLVIFAISFLFAATAIAQTLSISQTKAKNIRDEIYLATETNPYIGDLPREFVQSLNDFGQARTDAALVHTFYVRSLPCVKTIYGIVEITAAPLNRGAANDRIGIFRRGLAIGSTSQLWVNNISRDHKVKLNYALSRSQLDSFDNEGRLTIAIQDDTRIDGLTLKIRRDYSNCRSNLIS